MKRSIGLGVLVLSAAGYPLTEIVQRRWKTPGALVVEAVCIGLTVRDASMIADGVPSRLHPLPATLLRLELATGVVASAAGLHDLLRRAETAGPGWAAPESIRVLRHLSVMALFALHTIRFGIYLQPGQGRRDAS